MKQQRNSIMKDFLRKHESPEIARFVDQNLEITEQVHALLKVKGWSQKELAEAMGKTPAEVSRWLSGQHNLTLKTIAKLETVLKADIILTPRQAIKRYHRVEYVTFKVHGNINQVIPSEVAYADSPVHSHKSKVVKMPQVA